MLKEVFTVILHSPSQLAKHFANSPTARSRLPLEADKLQQFTID